MAAGTRPEWDIVDQCRGHLEALPGIRKVIVRTPVRLSDLPSADVGVVLETDVGEYRYLGSVKRRLTPSKLDHWLLLTLPRAREYRNDGKPILLADYISPANAERLREADVDYVDAAGNLLIHRPGKLHLLRSGARPRRLVESRPARLFMPSGLQVLFVLLVEPVAAELSYRELAAHSGVALGSIAVIVNELRDKGYLLRHRARWRLVRRRELLERWVSGYSEQLRPKLLLGVFTAPEKAAAANWQHLRAALHQREIDAALTGGLAADQLTRHYQGGDLAAFVSDWPKGMQQALRWLPSPTGAITLLREFSPAVRWSSGGEPQVAHPLLVYAELLHSGRERDRETARMIYERYLEHIAADDPA
ncbi:MAG TPA: type IV toxin-antitoxin system AbiEi family antitoxin [Vicinamibacterales bacterium]|nr:type IV toxin-antitoxin system AbiEi family antitoxin [Vicinamibacterales bacterium]